MTTARLQLCSSSWSIRDQSRREAMTTRKKLWRLVESLSIRSWHTSTFVIASSGFAWNVHGGNSPLDAQDSKSIVTVNFSDKMAILKAAILSLRLLTQNFLTSDINYLIKLEMFAWNIHRGVSRSCMTFARSSSIKTWGNTRYRRNPISHLLHY